MNNKTACLILFLSFVFCGANAQKLTEEEIKIKNDIWKNAPEAFKSTILPDKWKNESAVILATDLDYIADYKTKMTGLTSVSSFWVEKVTSHYRVKLIDKAAVKEFSELSFNEKFVSKNIFGRSNSYFIVGVKVIKADGTEKEINLDKAVSADSDSKKDLKIAVPDLEQGDIIDYFSASKQEYISGSEGRLSDNFLFEGTYPIVKRTMRFMIPHQSSIKSTVFNGAPNFSKTVKENDVIYALEDNMREKAKDLLWTFDHRTSPEIRYILETGTVKSPQEIANEYASSFGMNMSDIGFIMDFMKENYKKETDPNILINEVYYLLRNPIYLKAYFQLDQNRPLDVDYVSDQSFSLLSKYFIKNKISHNLMIVPYRKLGPFNEQKTISADLILRVNDAKPIYLKRITPFAIPNEFSYEYEGMSGVTSSTLPKTKGTDTYSDDNKIPVSTFEHNNTVTTLNVKVNTEDNSKIDVVRSVVAKGHNKEPHQYMVVTNYDYLKEYNQPKYQAESSSLIGNILKQYNKEMKNLEQRLTQDYNERDKKLKEDVETSMSVKIAEYKNFKLKSIGMWNHTPNTEYTDEFTIENIVKKAGPNYIIELPKLIEQQIKVKDEDVKRDRDVHMNYARSFVNEINLAIPEGYSVEGLDALNKNVDNAYGSFTSIVKVEGSTLKIVTTKKFKTNYCSAEDWSKMVEFMNAAVDFTNAKILLKKA